MMLSGDDLTRAPGVRANPWAPGKGTVAMINNPVPRAGRSTVQKALISPWSGGMNTYRVAGQTVNLKPGYRRASGSSSSMPTMARIPGGRRR